MTLTPENTRRKVDSLGRVTIPKSLRDRYGYKENDELEFFTLEADGKQYTCLSSDKAVDPKYRAAALVLEELGLDIPTELQDRIV